MKIQKVLSIKKINNFGYVNRKAFVIRRHSEENEDNLQTGRSSV